MAFPQTPLDVRTELQIGGTWTDVSADTYLRDPISITWGRSDEAARPDPSKCTITFNNRLGKFSPRNPVGPYFGSFGRNTPVRVSVPAATRALRLPGTAAARASTPDASALDVVGDLDVRVDATLESWDTGQDFVDLIGKWQADGNLSWRLSLAPGGYLYFTWSPDGTVANSWFTSLPDSPLPVPPSGRLSVRVTLDVNNGASGNTTSFYYSTTAGTSGPWTLLGSYVLSGTTSVFNSTAALEVGDITGTVSSIPPVGRVHSAEMRNGIGGTVVASPDFSVPAAGAASFVDGAGRTWSPLGDAEISDRRYRFHGEVSSWPPKWDVSGKDRYVPVEAAGQLRRYGAGTNPLQSTLRRRIPSANPLAYWAMEDGSDASHAASALTGGRPATFTGVTWAGADTLPGSSPLPTIGTASILDASVPPPPAGTAGWHIEWVFRIDTAPASATPLLNIGLGSGAVRDLKIICDANGPNITGYDADGSSVFTSGSLGPPFGNWARLAVYAVQNGGNVNLTIKGTLIGGGGGSITKTYAGAVGNISRVYCQYAAALQGASIGHIGVFTTPGTSVYDFADTGFVNEQAHARICRLCDEESMPVVFPSGTGYTAAMGPQKPDALLTLLGDCADADMGVLYESREFARLAYRRHSSFETQAAALALDYALDGDVSPPLEPVDDDQAARNDITVSRVNGASARATQEDGPLSVLLPPDGIGPVPGGGTYNVATDDQLPDMAGWQLHLGTADQARYPSVHVDLAAGPHLIDAATSVKVGHRITIAHPPPEAGGIGDTLDLLAQGGVETLGLYDWDLTFNCTPGSPWQVAVLGDNVLGRADTDGSELAAAATAAAATLSVTTSSGPLWTTDPAEFPFDLIVSGEVVTATACSGTASPQTMTVTRAVNGVSKPQNAGADVRLAHPMIVTM